jgi:hypothetical protein
MEKIMQMKIGFEEAFKSRFLNFTGNMNLFSISASFFKIDVQATPKRFKMALRDLQNNGKITLEFLNESLLKFYKLCLPQNNFHQLYRQAKAS